VVGVGLWVGEWLDDDWYDFELFCDGDVCNVVDCYCYWWFEVIVVDFD